jgi:hypothetical protein
MGKLVLYYVKWFVKFCDLLQTLIWNMSERSRLLLLFGEIWNCMINRSLNCFCDYWSFLPQFKFSVPWYYQMSYFKCSSCSVVLNWIQVKIHHELHGSHVTSPETFVLRVPGFGVFKKLQGKLIERENAYGTVLEELGIFHPSTYIHWKYVRRRDVDLW